MSKLNDLIATGEALIEARKNPADAAAKFTDFGEAYDLWYVAGKELIRRLSGRAAAARWSFGECRRMYRLDLDPVACLKDQQRQQAMLVALREESAATPPPPVVASRHPAARRKTRNAASS